MAFRMILEMEESANNLAALGDASTAEPDSCKCELDQGDQCKRNEIVKKNCSGSEAKINEHDFQKGADSSDSSNVWDEEKNNDLNEPILSITYYVINVVDDCFFNAVRIIRSEKVIGVSLEGDISRFGSLSCLNINVCDVVFVFDILKLQLNGFGSGLQDILESPRIMKVMHDCRMASDCLYHCYSVTMVNVFDTQVADVMNHFENEQKLPQYTNSLACSLQAHLNIPSHHFITPTPVHLKKVADSEWMERPIPKQLLKRSVLNVMFLIDLRSSLLEKLLQKFNDGIRVFQNCVTDLKNDEEVEEMLESMHKVPSELDQVVMSSKRVTHVYDNVHPKFRFTRDVWSAR